jgi:hypothetical protein
MCDWSAAAIFPPCHDPWSVRMESESQDMKHEPSADGPLESMKGDQKKTRSHLAIIRVARWVGLDGEGRLIATPQQSFLRHHVRAI